MKRRVLKIVLVIAVALIAARELGLVRLYYYNSNITGSLNSNWSNTNNVIPFSLNDSFWRQHKVNLETENRWFHTKLPIKDLGVYVVDNHGNHIGTYDTVNPQFYVNVSQVNYGFLWVPLYKSVTFSAQASCSESISKLKQVDTLATQTIYNVNGTMSISGSVTIKGFCSAREARQIIDNYILQQFYDCVCQQRDQLEGI